MFGWKKEISEQGERWREMERDGERWRAMERDGERWREMERGREREGESEREVPLTIEREGGRGSPNHRKRRVVLINTDGMTWWAVQPELQWDYECTRTSSLTLKLIKHALSA